MQVRRAVAIVLCLVALIIGGLIGSVATAKAVAGHAVPILVATGSDSRLAEQVSFTNGFAPVVKEVAGAVVNISSSRIVRNQGAGPMAPFFNDPFFRQFFGNQFRAPQRQRETSLGSGVIVNANGYILTNNHVVEGATEVRVSLSDKRELRAKVVGTDPRTDIAVVKLDLSGLPVVKLGDSSQLQVGDFCLAIGDPFGIGQTVTSGIISAKGRSGLGIEALEDFIQTDAAINPGNSGGALVNVRGELIGINTAILSESRGNVGIGFAIPINMARQVMDQIIKTGKVNRAYMGILPQDVTPAIARSFGLKEPEGILVGQVEPNSPASQAGIQQGDILTEMNGKKLTDVGQFRVEIGMMSPGSTVHFKVLRNGNEHDAAVKLGSMPAEKQASAPGEAPGGNALEGLLVDDLTPDILQELHLPSTTKGVVITDVAQGSAAAEAGLQRGDVIQQVNRRPVTSVSQFNAAVRQAGKQTVLLLVNRAGNTMYVTVEPE